MSYKRMTSLCVGCGACLGVCPKNAIHIENKKGLLTVSFNPEKCVNCFKCVKICPVLSNLQTVKPNFHDALGKIKKVFFGYSTNNNLRYNGASGGIVTSLLLYMLQHKLVDKVLVVRMEGFTVKPLLTGNEDEVISAQGSIYFKTFSLRILQDIIHNIKKGKRLGIVGLPCQISTLKKRLKNYENKTFFIGLICNHTNEYWYMHHIIERYLPKNTKPLGISARKDGWPGTIKILFKSKNQNPKETRIDYNTQFWGLLPSLGISAPSGCLICTDHLASKADIVAADAWHPKYVGNDVLGVSIILVRTEKGLKLIKSALKNKWLNVEEAKLLDLFISQSHNIIETIEYAPFRQKLIQHPTNTIGELREIDKTITALILIANRHLIKHRIIRRMLNTKIIEKLLQIILWHLSLHESIRLRKCLKNAVFQKEKRKLG